MGYRTLSALLSVFATWMLLGCGNGQTTEPREAQPPTVPKLPERPTLQRADPLPKLARSLLNKRMNRHGEQMEQLSWATLTVSRPMIKSLARAIADESRIARPDPDDPNSLNHVFPEQFFVLQEELRTHALALASATDQEGDNAVAEAYGNLTRTCVRCHSLYLTFPVRK